MIFKKDKSKLARYSLNGKVKHTMKFISYILAGIILCIASFIIWFFLFYYQIPELHIPKKTTSQNKFILVDNWFKDLNNSHKFNGGFLFTINEKPVLAKTYGFTDVKKTKKLNNNSSFRLASISKQFTAVGIMLLKEKNKLNYNDLVTMYISDFPYANVTIRHLLNQTSGIPDEYIKLAQKQKKEIEILTNKKALQLLIKNKPKVNANPNEQYEYSNTNYIILARIIEIISNQSFELFMKNNVFIPLKMNNTRIWNLASDVKNFPDKTGGFQNLLVFEREIKPTFVDGVAGDDAIFSSINDFIIWDKFWYKNDLISKKNMKEAFKRPTLNNGELSNYGFGWVIINDNIAMHKGGWLAANTYYIRNTRNKTSMLLLDNSSNIWFDKIIENINNVFVNIHN